MATTPDGKNALVVISDSALFNHLYTVIQDAQASGSIVHIVTILPATQQSLGDLGYEPTGCKPKADTCPK